MKYQELIERHTRPICPKGDLGPILTGLRFTRWLVDNGRLGEWEGDLAIPEPRAATPRWHYQESEGLVARIEMLAAVLWPEFKPTVERIVRNPGLSLELSHQGFVYLMVYNEHGDERQACRDLLAAVHVKGRKMAKAREIPL